MINQYISLVLLAYFASYCLAAIESQCMPNRIANPSWLTTGVELVENPSFEDGRSPWLSGDEEGWDRIYASDALFGACGLWYAKIDSCPSRAGCMRPNAAVFQIIQVNQSQPKPIVVSVHSIGSNVNGSYGNDYSLYADVQHFDGTFTYGYYAPFFLGIPLWQFNSFIIQNPKPIKSLIVYGIFRNFVGTVYFDEFSVQEATVASANLLVNPSFDGGNENNCTAPIYGWSNINPNSPYITCPEPPAYLINSPPGFIGTPGDNGLSGAEQRVLLRQTQPLKITFRVYARWSRTTVSGPYVVVHDARLLVTYTDGTQDTAIVEITDTTQVRVYTITFIPTKAVSFVDVQLRFDGGGYEGTIIHWDDASLVQGG